MDRVRLSAELCATYWLFMLFVWVVLLSLLAGWAGEFLDFCAQLLS
jgi:cytochrome c oxidase subunit 3